MDQKLNNGKIFVEIPDFEHGNVPVSLAAKVMHKDVLFVRLGLQQGELPFGSAFVKEGSSQYDYYISPFLLWQYTGYVYRGDDCV